MELGFVLIKGKSFADKISKIISENDYTALGIYHNYMDQGVKFMVQYSFNRVSEYPGTDIEKYNQDCLISEILLREIRSEDFKNRLKLMLIREGEPKIFEIISELFDIQNSFNVLVERILNDREYLSDYNRLNIHEYSEIEIKNAEEKSKISQYYVMNECFETIFDHRDVLQIGNIFSKYWQEFLLTLIDESHISFKIFHRSLSQVVTFLNKITDEDYQFHIKRLEVLVLHDGEKFEPTSSFLGVNKWCDIFERIKLFISYINSNCSYTSDIFFGMINDITRKISKFSDQPLIIFDTSHKKYYFDEFVVNSHDIKSSFQDIINDMKEMKNMVLQKNKTPKIYLDNLINKINAHAAELGMDGIDGNFDDLSSNAIIVTKSRRNRDFELINGGMTIITGEGVLISTQNPDISVLNMEERVALQDYLEVFSDKTNIFAELKSKLVG